MAVRVPRWRLLAGFVAIIGLAVLAGCAPTSTDYLGANAKTITVAWNQAFYSYNPNTSTGNNSANANIGYLTNSSFNYYDNHDVLRRNTAFGHYEELSSSPTVVKYTINPGVTWSDGVPIDAADMLLGWVANSGVLNSKGYVPQHNSEGGLIAGSDPDKVYFDGAIGGGLERVTQVPEINDGGRSVTMHFDGVFVDWENTAPGPGVAAHVVAEKALGIKDPMRANAALVAAVEHDDKPALKKIADVWNTAFNFTSLPKDPSLYLSSGPYVLSALKANQYLTVSRNPRYAWGPRPKFDQITVRFIGDPMAQVTALQNGEVDVIYPQSTTDVLEAVRQLRHLRVDTSPEASYEHLDLQMKNSKNPGVFADPRVREAFLKVVPRQEIVDKLIRPLDPHAAVRNSFLADPDFPSYPYLSSRGGMDRYDTVDVAGAKSLLAQAGASHPTVCVLYDSSNTRRVNEFQLIQASAARAGFTVTNCGSSSWSSLMGNAGAYDAALFAWQSTSTAVSQAAATFVSGGINNFNFYSNPQVDALFAQLSQTPDKKVQLQIQAQIERTLTDDAVGVTLFQFPGLTAWSDTVTGIVPASLQPTYFWNFWQWDRAAR